MYKPLQFVNVMSHWKNIPQLFHTSWLTSLSLVDLWWMTPLIYYFINILVVCWLLCFFRHMCSHAFICLALLADRFPSLPSFDTGIFFWFRMMWNILHFGLACVCAAATHPCSFLVSFTFSTLLSYISLNPRTQLQNWLKEIWDFVTKYHNNKEASRLR